MKLVYLTSARIPDDWAHVIQILKMCEAFADAGLEVVLLAPRRAGTRAEDPYAFAGVKKNFQIQKITCLDVSATSQSRLWYWVRTFSFFISAKWYLRRQTYDVLYTRERIASLFFTSFIFEAHTVSKTDQRLLDRAQKIVALTSFIKRSFIELGFSSTDILVAPDGVTLEEFEIPVSKQEARAKLGLPQEANIVGYTGTLKTFGKSKGLDTAIKAFAATLDALLCIVGGEPEDVEEYKKVAHENGVADRIFFTGKRPHGEVPLYLRAFDVAILPIPDTDFFRHFTSPLKLFEYMAAHVPMVASDLPTIREVVGEGEAVLVAPDNAEALAEGISALLRDPLHAHQLSTKSFNKAALYSWRARGKHIFEFMST